MPSPGRLSPPGRPRHRPAERRVPGHPFLVHTATWPRGSAPTGAAAAGAAAARSGCSGRRARSTMSGRPASDVDAALDAAPATSERTARRALDHLGSARRARRPHLRTRAWSHSRRALSVTDQFRPALRAKRPPSDVNGPFTLLSDVRRSTHVVRPGRPGEPDLRAAGMAGMSVRIATIRPSITAGLACRSVVPLTGICTGRRRLGALAEGRADCSVPDRARSAGELCGQRTDRAGRRTGSPGHAPAGGHGHLGPGKWRRRRGLCGRLRRLPNGG